MKILDAHEQIEQALPDAAKPKGNHPSRLHMLKAMLARAEAKRIRFWANGLTQYSPDKDRAHKWFRDWEAAIKEEIFECQHPTLLPKKTYPRA